jgi:inward rectifier potassium channel
VKRPHVPRRKHLPLSAAALRAIERRGVTRYGVRDLYHTLMRVPLPGLFALLAGAFLLINLIFAALYWTIGGLGGPGHSGFAAAFFFSMQTLSTTGYGAVYPVSLAANSISSVEIFLGLLSVALTTGLLFARLSKPRARVLFSKVVIIRTYRGTPTLMFRMINERRNGIAEAHVSVTMTQEEDDGGSVLRRMIGLKLERDTSPIFALSWLVMHPITPDSPLYGKTEKDIAAAGNILVCMLSGTDDTLNESIFARHVYGAEDFRFGHKFVDVIERSDTGEVVIDYNRFHDTTPE